MRYSLTEVNIDDKHMERLKSAIENNKAAMIRIFLKEPRENTLLLTKGQILKIQQGQMQGKDSISIKLSMPQIKANIDSGGFLGEVEEDLLLREGEEEDFDRKLECRWCSKKFTLTDIFLELMTISLFIIMDYNT